MLHSDKKKNTKHKQCNNDTESNIVNNCQWMYQVKYFKIIFTFKITYRLAKNLQDLTYAKTGSICRVIKRNAHYWTEFTYLLSNLLFATIIKYFISKIFTEKVAGCITYITFSNFKHWKTMSSNILQITVKLLCILLN